MLMSDGMMKMNKMTRYQFIKQTIRDTRDRNAIYGLLSMSLDAWRNGEFYDVVFADILYTAAKKYIDIQ